MPMLPVDLPPADVHQAALKPVAAISAQAVPECRLLTQEEAGIAFQRLRQSLPSTAFDNAKPSQICGLVRVQMASGKVVYTDATGRFLLLTFALDTHRGSPADNSEELQQAIEDRSGYPDQAVPGLTPPPPVEDEAQRQSLMR